MDFAKKVELYKEFINTVREFDPALIEAVETGFNTIIEAEATKFDFQIQGKYEGTWKEVYCKNDPEEARTALKKFREQEPGIEFKINKVRSKKEVLESQEEIEYCPLCKKHMDDCDCDDSESNERLNRKTTKVMGQRKKILSQ